MYRTSSFHYKRPRTSSFNDASQLSYSTAPLSSASGQDNTTLAKASRQFKGKVKVLPKNASKRLKEIAKIANRVVKKTLNSNVEVKYMYQSGTGQSVGQTHTTAGPTTASGHWTSAMTVPNQGAASNQRIGDKVRIKFFQINFAFTPLVNTCNSKHLKFMVVRFRAPNPVVSIANVINPNQAIDVANGGSGSGSVVAIYDTYSTKYFDSDQDVTIIFEKDMVLDPTPSGSGAGTKKIMGDFCINIPMYDRVHEMSGGTLINNSYALMLLCDSGDRGATNPALVGLQEQTANTGLAFQYNTVYAFTDI